MSKHRIDELVWLALTDLDFRTRLLNGQRYEALDAFSFTEAEKQAIMAVKADTLEAFAGALSQPNARV
ncbi:MAG TPA: hypothetical protein ENN19_06005 [Chloroflexi bacterium]|mgnify:CR=1 FL=1|nr:hypothetical protein [Chloroflexota bacterium]